MADVKGAIFDLDGTLLDTDSLWEDIDREFLSRRGIALPDDYIDAVNAMSFRKAAEYTIKRFSFPDTADELIAEWNEMSRYAYGHTVHLYPGCFEYLEKLKAKGILIAAATDLDREIAESSLVSNGIRELFDAVLTTGEVGMDKSSPAVFLEAAHSISLAPSSCVVYEDLDSALSVASAAGFAVIDAASFHIDCLSLIS